MATILFFFFLWITCKAAKSAWKHDRAKPRGKTAQSAKIQTSLASLENLQQQRDILTDLLENIDFQLQFIPPEKTREKLLKDKARLYGQLATVESKIQKLIN